MNTAIHFGAGNIGRGFIGGLLSGSGYRVVFADINPMLIEKLKKEQRYSIFVVDETPYEQVIENVTGLLIDDDELLLEAEKADLITTAVGPTALTHIAACVAKCITKRQDSNIKKHLNIIACENIFGASGILKKAVLRHLDENASKYAEEFIGFPDSVVDRIVPPGTTDEKHLLSVKTEPFFEWIVDSTAIKGDIPHIDGMIKTEKLLSYVERKLLTLNTGHAITAYLGKISDCKSIRESISDNWIYSCVSGAMQESGSALIKKHGFDKAAHYEYIEKILCRFKNPYLNDDVDRVGREPLRKLSLDDRLIKPVLLAVKHDVEPTNLILGAAAAFHFYTASDPQSVEMQSMIAKMGLRKAISKISSLEEESEIVEKITNNYHFLVKHAKNCAKSCSAGYITANSRY
jgi:mannitol-1-phosphate 5-dehydrogenase